MAATTIGPDARETVIVIGAGAAGLAVAAALARQGIEALVLERESRLAEPWRKRHADLHLNTHRALSALPGLPYLPGTSAFPHKDVIVSYLERFAAENAIAVEYGTAVERIERDGDCWLVHTAAGVRRASHVVVATGRDRLPWMPHWQGAGDFGGGIVHAADFGAAQDYAGLDVLVVGAGNSGFDVLNHLARVATGSLWLSARHGPSILPRRIGKVAVHRFAGIMAHLPVSVADAAIVATQRLAFGNLQRHGLPPATRGGASRLTAEQIAIAVDDGAVAALKAGRITVVPPVKAFLPDAVELDDASTIRPDVVIAATGYRTGLEPMVGALGVLDGKGVPLVNGGTPAGMRGLWFAGMRPSLTSYFHSAGLQACAIARQIAKTQ